MPRTTKTGRRKKSRAVVRRRRPRRSQRGGSWWRSLWKFGKKANTWLRKTHAFSKGARLAHDLGVPVIGEIGNVASQLGYGKRKRTVRRRRRRRTQRAGGISPSGGALLLAGAGRYRIPKNGRRPTGISF